MRRLLLLSSLLLAGCATTAEREAAAEARGYEHGYRQAVKEQYWIIQRMQGAPAPQNQPQATP